MNYIHRPASAGFSWYHLPRQHAVAGNTLTRFFDAKLKVTQTTCVTCMSRSEKSAGIWHMKCHNVWEHDMALAVLVSSLSHHALIAAPPAETWDATSHVPAEKASRSPSYTRHSTAASSQKNNEPRILSHSRHLPYSPAAPGRIGLRCAECRAPDSIPVCEEPMSLEPEPRPL